MLQRDRQRQRERGTAGGGGAGAFTAEYLVIAGGGGGGRRGAGGGAGGYRSSVTGESSGGGASAESALSIALGAPYTVTVGAGGSGSVSTSVAGGNGGDSVLNTITSIGGGGAGSDGDKFGKNGGSGGGGANAGTGGNGTSAQGFNGGNATATDGTGGGGGAGELGNNGVSASHGGDGGDGVLSSINGSAVFRAGGGGGSNCSPTIQPGTPGSGGLGGGGDAKQTTAGDSGVANTGSGGGGGGGTSGTNYSGGNGGSGVVIIRVPSSVVAEFSAGVVYNYIPLDDFNVYEITAAGVADTVTFSQGALATIEDSLRFNDDDSAYLTRTPASAGDRKTWTWSGWVKRGNLSFSTGIIDCYDDSNNNTFVYFEPGDTLQFHQESGGATKNLNTTAVFRDSSAWYHIVIQVDTTAATSTNRVNIYVNGVKQTLTGTYPGLNENTFANDTASTQRLGTANITAYFDGYLSDVYFIDGQALDPSRFAKQDADGVWQPISYTGSYGTNGFHLDFADNSTAAALGTDVSGNSNDWTPSGITTDDQVTDTPTVNYCTLNATDKATATLSNGNLAFSFPSQSTARGTFGVSSGKWYWEMTAGTTSNVMVGIATPTAATSNYLGSNTEGWAYFSDGRKFNGTSSAYGSAFTAGVVVGIAFDADAGSLTFYRNGVSQGVAFFGLSTNQVYMPACGHISGSGTFNFGQQPFTYTPPTGFQALNSANLPAPVIADGKEHFQPALYTGNGTTQAIGGLEFSPDLVWIKNRSAADNHKLLDAMRGATEELESNTTDAEVTNSDGLTAFNSNGFTVGADLEYNTSGENFVAWNWNAGGSTVTNTDGSITSQVRANPTAGFSIVSYSQGASGATVGHGLGKAPDFIIAKSRTVSRVWVIYSSYLGKDKYLLLSTNAASTIPNFWGATAPDSSVFGLSLATSANNHGGMIAYCFAGVEGFSKFGGYTGNGSTDGPFVYTGFRPAFVMLKASSVSGEAWAIMDNKRLGYNVINSFVQANTSGAEFSYGGGGSDILSNGFKLRSTSTGLNGSGITFIYMAFAENPFKTARAR